MPNYPLVDADLASNNLRPDQISKLVTLIEHHIAEGRYPGCQIALARHGRLLLNQSFGQPNNPYHERREHGGEQQVAPRKIDHDGAELQA